MDIERFIHKNNFDTVQKELQRVIDDDNKRREFMKNKETTRIAKHQATRKGLATKTVNDNFVNVLI